MNVYDSDRMADILAALNFKITADIHEADLAILNTCHIREKATEKVYSDLGRLKEIRDENHGQRPIIAVAGCMAQAEGDEILQRTPYVDMVFGPQTYHQLPQMLAEFERRRSSKTGAFRGVLNVDFPEEIKFDYLPEISAPQGVAALLSIQEGCDKFCHFCVVPYTRGAEYSRPAADILRDARILVSKGVHEITLLGQNVNAYHGQAPQGTHSWSLGRLIRELADIDGLERLRYTTSHPRDVDRDLIEAHRDVTKLMPCLHLPVQSGSDKILESMNRKHTVAFYKDLIYQFREAQPNIIFSSDFIVGYPGETDKDFQQTLDLVEEVKYTQAYSFKYSPRPGTPAVALPRAVDDAVMTERLNHLQDRLRCHQLTFNQSMVGRILPILWDRRGRKEGQLIGRSPYLQSVHAFCNPENLGNFSHVRILGTTSNSLSGEIVEEAQDRFHPGLSTLKDPSSEHPSIYSSQR